MASAFELAKSPIQRDIDGRIVNAMTVDVEDYYHAHVLESFFTRDKWPSLERRVVANTEQILDLFAQNEIKGTFFTLGSVAKEFPGLIRKIVANGHELASHGLEHFRASEQDRQTFLRDITAAKAALEDAGGVEVHGYRAASFSIGRDNWWAFEALEEAGYSYSSSISVAKLSGMDMEAPSTPFFPCSGKLIEYPITTVPMLGRDVPTGGGYFRLAPYAMFRQCLRTSQTKDPQPANFYFHPWEIDPDQPEAEVAMQSKLRHRVNLGRMKAKIASLLTDFRWGRMSDAYDLKPHSRN